MQAISPQVERLVLTGFMGAGKTTVGRLLATRLGWEFLDLDVLIESGAGLSVANIFATHGEPRFRELESNALAYALGRDNIVLALGGGTPEIPGNRMLLERAPATAIIFLDAPFAVLYDRCMVEPATPGATLTAAQLRPVLADPALEARFRARQPLYRRLAQHTIDTAILSPQETVATLLLLLHASPRPS